MEFTHLFTALTVGDVGVEDDKVQVSKEELKKLQELAALYVASVGGESSEPSAKKKQKK